MITESSIEKAFDGNAEYDDEENFPPEYSVNVSVKFDSAIEAQNFVGEIEALLAHFRRRTASTKRKKVQERA
jgi:hypothetical protein